MSNKPNGTQFTHEFSGPTEQNEIPEILHGSYQTISHELTADQLKLI